MTVIDKIIALAKAGPGGAAGPAAGRERTARAPHGRGLAGAPVRHRPARPRLRVRTRRPGLGAAHRPARTPLQHAVTAPGHRLLELHPRPHPPRRHAPRPALLLARRLRPPRIRQRRPPHHPQERRRRDLTPKPRALLRIPPRNRASTAGAGRSSSTPTAPWKPAVPTADRSSAATPAKPARGLGRMAAALGSRAARDPGAGSVEWVCASAAAGLQLGRVIASALRGRPRPGPREGLSPPLDAPSPCHLLHASRCGPGARAKRMTCLIRLYRRVRMQASFAGWRRNCGLPRVPEIPARSSGCETTSMPTLPRSACPRRSWSWRASTGSRAGRG